MFLPGCVMGKNQYLCARYELACVQGNHTCVQKCVLRTRRFLRHFAAICFACFCFSSIQSIYKFVFGQIECLIYRFVNKKYIEEKQAPLAPNLLASVFNADIFKHITVLFLLFYAC